MDLTRKGMLIVISGPSGVGKGTIFGRVLEVLPEIGFSVSMTTRAPRHGEVDGKDYLFTSENVFESMAASGGFLEYTRVFGGNYYGTPKAPVIARLEAGTDIILDVDVTGAANVKKSFPEAVLIFIVPPSMEELEHRLVSRGTETAESIIRRTRTAYDELRRLPEYDYVVVNDDIADAVSDVETIIEAERLKTMRRTGVLKTFA